MKQYLSFEKVYDTMLYILAFNGEYQWKVNTPYDYTHHIWELIRTK